jgi:hypothetical protein
MDRIRRTLVVAIVGMAILGFGLISTVEAVKPPPRGGYPDAVRIFPVSPNTIYESDASYFLIAWYYYVSPEWNDKELFPQPVEFQFWIGNNEVKLSRHAIGHGELDELFPPEELQYIEGPLFRWYAYFEPYTFDVGVYDTHAMWTFKDPNSPSDRQVFEGWGQLTVLSE